MTKLEAALAQLANNAASGDIKALREENYGCMVAFVMYSANRIVLAGFSLPKRADLIDRGSIKQGPEVQRYEVASASGPRLLHRGAKCLAL